MLGNHFVLLRFSDDDDNEPDNEAQNQLRSLSWRGLIARATGGIDLQAVASRLPGVVLPALGRSIMSVIAWHAIALLIRLP